VTLAIATVVIKNSNSSALVKEHYTWYWSNWKI